MIRRIWMVAMITAVGMAGWAGYRLVRSQIAGEVYRQRLIALQTDYQQLRGQYNQAVRKTAVTELLVRDGSVSVVVRDASGEVRTIPTPYDPTNEIYVDYVVVDGRLWIRRVFDDQTPPDQGVVIDPKWAEVDWADDGAVHGKAAYRRLTPGRWIITVTGDGSLGLAKSDDGAPLELESAPKVREYQPAQEAMVAVERIGPMDVIASLLAPF